MALPTTVLKTFKHRHRSSFSLRHNCFLSYFSNILLIGVLTFLLSEELNYRMVNVDILKSHAGQYKLTKDTAAEYHKQLFKLHPELANHYDAEDLDPDSIPRSQKFIMLGMQELQLFFRLPQTVDDERKWRQALSGFKENYSDVGFPLNEFNKVTDAFLAAMAKNAGGVSAEQKKEWEELIKKACADMKTWGWY